MTIQLPTDLEEQVSALAQSGVYESPDAIVRDALQTLLAARPDLREAVAWIPHQREVFSIGRAAEWSGRYHRGSQGSARETRHHARGARIGRRNREDGSQHHGLCRPVPGARTLVAISWE